MCRKSLGLVFGGWGALLGIFISATASADVIVSSKATRNMVCSAGICAPTASDAVLNVSDLETLLASANIEVTTTGSGGVQATNIDVDSALTWSAANTLALDAYNAITVDRQISVTGPGGLSLMTANSTLLWFRGKGHVVFQNLSGRLTVDGTAYTLVNDIKSLASAIAADPSGAYALANNYDASADGTYKASPIQTEFKGTFEGLGNVISHLSIDASGSVGLFAGDFGTINDLGVVDAKIRLHGGAIAGVIAGVGNYMTRDFATGSIEGRGRQVGGIVAVFARLELCYADVKISVIGAAAGGLTATGSSDKSFATGPVTVSDRAIGGGLVGINLGGISNSYSTGEVAGGIHSKVGGFAGENSQINGVGAVIANSYSTGKVSGGPRSLVGGYAGTVYHPSRIWNNDVYWDVDTSGTNQGTGKGNKNGIFGLSSGELQSGLPEGFDPAIWAQNKTINNGFPYLIANPPPK